MYKLLIAEDVEIIRNMLVNTIDWKPLDVKVIGAAADGQEALESMNTEVPDIVITDIRMPGMDGFRLILAAQEKHPAIKYIILTAHSDFNYAQNAIKLGVVDYVLKPLDVDELCAAVRKAIQQIQDERERERQREMVSGLLKEKLPNVLTEDSHISPSASAKNIKVVEKAMDYIKANIYTDISVQEVADKVFLNPKYLNTLFKQATGENISKYIIRCKLEKAAEMLKDPAVKIYEVCDKMGYQNQNYFRDIFTAHFGISPSEYRRRYL